MAKATFFTISALWILGTSAGQTSPSAANQNGAQPQSQAQGSTEAAAGRVEQIRRYYAAMPPRQRFWTAASGILNLISWVMLLMYGLLRAAVGGTREGITLGRLRSIWLKATGVLFVLAGVASFAISQVYYSGRILQPVFLMLVGIAGVCAGMSLSGRMRSRLGEQAMNSDNR